MIYRRDIKLDLRTLRGIDLTPGRSVKEKRH
jgi:hypothetical protein